MSSTNFLSNSAVPPALYATVNSVTGLEKLLYCSGSGSHSFFGGTLHCTTQFAMGEMRAQQNTGTVKAGGVATFRIPKAGDQVYWMYAVLKLPGIFGAYVASGASAPACGLIPTWDSAFGCNDWNLASGTVEGADQGDNVAAWLCNSEIYKGAAAWFFKIPGTAELTDFGFSGEMQTDDISYLPGEADYLLTSASAGFNLPHQLGAWATWCNASGQKALKEINLKIGAQTIATLVSEYLFAIEEVGGKAGKRLDEMIGKRSDGVAQEILDHLIVDSMQTRYLYVPLPFWFTRAPAHTLSLLHLTLAPVDVEIHFEQLCKLIVRKSSSSAVKKFDGTDLRDEDIECSLSTTHIWLPVPERNRLMSQAGGQKVQIIQQVQHHTQTLDARSNNVRLDFNMPTLELLVMVRRRCHEQRNDWFNFSGIGGLDIVEHMGLKVNNNQIVNNHEGSWYRLVQNYQHHSLIPKSMIYTMSFALFPQELLVSGSMNFSRFDTIVLELKLQDKAVSPTEDTYSSGPGTLHIFAPCWNVVQYKEGGLALVYA